MIEVNRFKSPFPPLSKKQTLSSTVQGIFWEKAAAMPKAPEGSTNSLA